MITIKMEITIATIGRLMKNLDTGLLLPDARSGGEWLWSHSHPRPDLLGAFGNHPIARLQSLIDDPHIADVFAGFHVPDCDLVVVADNRDLTHPLQLGYGALRD